MVSYYMFVLADYIAFFLVVIINFTTNAVVPGPGPVFHQIN